MLIQNSASLHGLIARKCVRNAENLGQRPALRRHLELRVGKRGRGDESQGKGKPDHVALGGAKKHFRLPPHWQRQ